MTSIPSGILLANPNVQLLDRSKLNAFDIAEARQGVYGRSVGAQEKFLQSRQTQHANTARNPTYKNFATVKVNGNIVAEINNHGGVTSSNALGQKILKLLAREENSGKSLSGPALAQARAEKIAEAFAGKVHKMPTALTMAQFNAVPPPPATVDYEAMTEDPLYARLQKTKEARTLFLTQQIAQETAPQKEETATVPMGPKSIFSTI